MTRAGDRADLLRRFGAVAGPLPAPGRRVPLDVAVTEEVDEGTHLRRRISFASEPGDRVPAWLCIPAGTGPHPAALCLHQTSVAGKDESVGLGQKLNARYASELAARGYVTIAPDYPGFGEYHIDVYAMGYRSAVAKAVWNNSRAVELLTVRSDVDAGGVVAIGHSLGAHTAIFAALHDPRIAAVVASCGFTGFPEYLGGDLTGWSHRGYFPLLATEYGLDPAQVPFDFPEIIAALAPRGLFVNAPLDDDNFDVAGVRRCVAFAAGEYARHGASDRLVAEYPDAGHDFPAEVRERSYDFLDLVVARRRQTAAPPPNRDGAAD